MYYTTVQPLSPQKELIHERCLFKLLDMSKKSNIHYVTGRMNLIGIRQQLCTKCDEWQKVQTRRYRSSQSTPRFLADLFLHTKLVSHIFLCNRQ